jgi:hypothetical protein
MVLFISDWILLRPTLEKPMFLKVIDLTVCYGKATAIHGSPVSGRAHSGHKRYQ